MVAAMKTTLSTKTTNIIPANSFTLLADLKASLCLRSDWFRSSNGLASYSAQLFSFGSIQLPDLDFYFDNRDIIAPNGVRVPSLSLKVTYSLMQPMRLISTLTIKAGLRESDVNWSSSSAKYASVQKI
ncbi:hypothetical protein F2Q69_00012371 [Brassica cretica]|uniref:Uncharacterized protein n=1 Tax=Brassica cretica TaxID=69181 RepID=A0A8S9QVA0_BRACR|nr:hypothetical protein F2Q69_00012371 [Brassica cretica]